MQGIPLSPAPSPHTQTLQPATLLDPTQVRGELEALLLQLSQDLYEMEICAGAVENDREGAVAEYLLKINQAFIQLSALSPQITDSVPRNVVENIDRYKNPHMYTKTALSRATGENQYALGRVLGLESFRRQLHDSLSQEFPTIPLPQRRHQPAMEEVEAKTEPGPPDESIKPKEEIQA
ncbi:mediator of RNA polymerase II transcription subunit 10, partial [Tremellales sp. Uapishka_1]